MQLQVGVKVFLKNRDGRYLLLQRNRDTYPNTNGFWDIVGGRIEVGTSLLENLDREVFEETRLTLTSKPVLLFAQDIFVRDEKHVVRLTYTALTEGEPVLDTKENVSYKWMTVEGIEAQKDLDIFVKEIVEKGLLT
jgi:ADP-ribose pyrophosphatase YjhB (NUDIX family)